MRVVLAGFHLGWSRPASSGSVLTALHRSRLLAGSAPAREIVPGRTTARPPRAEEPLRRLEQGHLVLVVLAVAPNPSRHVVSHLVAAIVQASPQHLERTAARGVRQQDPPQAPSIGSGRRALRQPKPQPRRPMLKRPGAFNGFALSGRSAESFVCEPHPLDLKAEHNAHGRLRTVRLRGLDSDRHIHGPTDSGVGAG